MRQMMGQAFELTEKEARAAGICSILDVSRSTGYARDLMNMQTMRILTRAHPKTRWVIIIDPTPHPAARFIGLTVIKILRLNYSTVRTLPEAMAIANHVLGLTAQNQLS